MQLLIIGLKKQLSEIDNSLLNTTNCVCNVVFISDKHLTFSYQISSIQSAASLNSWTPLYPSLPGF